MSITTYAELQTAIASWLNRAGDTTITTPATDFIDLFESKVLRKLRVRQMEARDTATLTAGTATIALPTSPDAFLEMRNLKLNTNPVTQLQYVTPNQLYSTWLGSTSGTPKVFTVSDSAIIFGPTPDSAYTVEMWFYQFDALSGSNTTNWLLTDFPDIYLYGSLVEASIFLGDWDGAAKWKGLVEEAMQDLTNADWRGRWSAGPLVMMTNTGNP